MAMLRLVLTALVDKRGAVLLRRWDEPTVTESNRWSLPGGGFDPPESPAKAARRLLLEQTGVTPLGQLTMVWHGFLPSVPVEVFFYAGATAARSTDLVTASPALSAFIPGPDVLSGRSFSPATGFVLGRFFDSLEYDALEARLDPDDFA